MRWVPLCVTREVRFSPVLRKRSAETCFPPLFLPFRRGGPPSAVLACADRPSRLPRRLESFRPRALVGLRPRPRLSLGPSFVASGAGAPSAH